uniref:Protein arginine N-methyltransferase 5 (Trinotate prediction) n=1 Tax=Myxobolus squamalis TaxID=59785 RepID=A0A6B2G530_MYXSQ
MDLKFTAQVGGIVHGFAGYFSCKLYNNISLSINPTSYSDGMFSWFPFFFPLKNPIVVGKDDKISLSIWRRCNPASVWYEWCLNSSPSMIHNSAGKHYSINLY